MDALMSKYDVFITPTGSSSLGLTNLTGHPAVALKAGFVANAPVEIMVTGRLYEEATMLRVALAYADQVAHHESFAVTSGRRGASGPCVRRRGGRCAGLLRAPTRDPSPGSPLFEARSRRGFGYARFTKSGRPPCATREPACQSRCSIQTTARRRYVRSRRDAASAQVE